MVDGAHGLGPGRESAGASGAGGKWRRGEVPATGLGGFAVGKLLGARGEEGVVLAAAFREVRRHTDRGGQVAESASQGAFERSIIMT